ncbi:MAG: ABC transporter permease [Vampirovibrionales bacterium]|nr:ABC transporter permease [Vampirovibrionales bacterium]
MKFPKPAPPGRRLPAVFRDRAAFWALLVLIALYAAVAFADFIAPYGEQWSDRALANAPPTPVYCMDATGAITWPYVLRVERRFDAKSLEYRFAPVLGERYPIRLLPKSDSARLWGIIPIGHRLMGVDAPARLSLLGLDVNGRDNFSRLLYGGQISLTIGFISLLISIPIGLLYGGASGYFGGWLDMAMMRVAEVIMSIPSLYLLITLASIIPSGLSSTQRFTMVAACLAAIGWAGFSRIIRGMTLGLRKQEFVEAARAMGAGHGRIILRHILPQTASFVIVALTLAVPDSILMESGLSFLGLGIQQPDASWGNMLKDAQTISNVLYSPWMLAPALLIFIAVLAFNVLGDAVRDALDPRSQSRSR